MNLFMDNTTQQDYRRKELFCRNLWTEIQFHIGDRMDNAETKKVFSILECRLSKDKQYGVLHFQLREPMPSSLMKKWEAQHEVNIVEPNEFSLFFQNHCQEMEKKLYSSFPYQVEKRKYVSLLEKKQEPQVEIDYYVFFSIDEKVFDLSRKIRKSIDVFREYYLNSL